MRTRSYRNRLIAATVLSSAFVATPALADCVSQAPVNPTQVVCDAPGTLGWNGSGTNSIVVTINAGATVSTSAGGPAMISTGTNSAVINFSGNFDGGVTPTVYGINAGSSTNAAISSGGGTIITNASGAAIQGTISFGNATGANVNVLNNNYSSSGGLNRIGLIDGNISAIGNFTFNNQGVVGWFTNAGVTQTGAGTVIINNGVDGGYAAAFGPYRNGFIWAGGGTAISTVGNTTLVNRGGGNALGGLIYGNVVLGTGGTGSSSLTNGSQAFGSARIVGNVTMADLNNTVTNDGTITGNVTMNGTGSNTYNAGSLGSSGDNGLRLPGSGTVGVTGATTGVVSGTLTGLANNSANNRLNLNGTGTSTLQVGSNILNFGVVNKNDSGTWIIKNTLDGAAGKLTTVNNNAGVLSVDNASFLGSSATTVNNTSLGIGIGGLIFNGTAAGTFAGNITGVGSVGITGLQATTFTGTNTNTGLVYIYNGGTLNANSNGALSAAADLYFGGGALGGGTLNVNANVSVNNLIDFQAGVPVSTININGTNSLSVAGGNFGNNGGVINGPGNLIKYSSGTLNLDGANQIAPGALIVNNGIVNDANGALAATTAVQVNSTATTTGVFNVLNDETIGSLAGTGANARVNISAAATLTTGGLNTNTTYAGQIAGAGALTKVGSGAMTLTGTNSYTGGTTVSDGFLVGTTNSLQGNIINNANVVFNQTVGGLGNGTYAGNMSGTGSLGKEGAGTVTLTGTNTYTGSTYLRAGTLAIGAATNIGTGQLQFSGGTLETTASLTLQNTIDLFGAGTVQTTGAGNTTTMNGPFGAGSLTKTGLGTLVLSGPSTYTGGTTVSAGTLQGVAGVGIQGNVVNNATVLLTGAFNIYGGNMSGNGNVVIQGTVGLAGTNTYSGATTVAAGNTLGALSPSGLSANSTHIINGALGDLIGGFNGNQTIGALSGSGTVQTDGNRLTTGGNNASTTFSGQFLAGSAILIKLGTGTFTLTGAGSVLSGTLGVNAGTLDLDGTLTAATTIVANGATLSVDGTLTSPFVTVAAGGLLIGGNGTTPGNIVGAVTNNGTVSPGHSPGILAIVGSYVQTSTGTYAAEVLANGTNVVVAGVDFDRIAVSGAPGTATLAGTLAVTRNSNLYVAGTTFDIITTTGGITGNFATVTGTNISAFLNLSNAAGNGGGVIGNNYRLVVVRSAYNTAAANPNQVAVANGLTGIIGSAGAAPTTNKIDNMTGVQAQALFAGLNPEPYAAYATSLQDQGNLFTRQVGNRLATNRGEEGQTGLWIAGYGSWGDGKSRGDYRFGNDHSITGFAAGVDFGSDSLRFGVAGGYSEDKVTFLQGNSSGKSESWQAGGYISYSADALHIDGQVAYISGDITATKLVNAGSGVTLIQGTAGASTTGNMFKGVLTVGYDFGGESFTFQPYVGVDFSSGKVNGFTESGMGILDLTIADIEADRTDLVIGARMAAPMGSVSPYLNASYRYDLTDHPGTVTGYFNGVSSAPFTVAAIGSGRSAIEVDAGISVSIGSTAGLYVAYQGSFRNDRDSHGVSAGLRLSF